MEGTLIWCFASHIGVIRPSGKMGELGESGDSGECSSNPGGGLVVEFCAEDRSGDIGGGAAFRSGKLNV